MTSVLHKKITPKLKNGSSLKSAYPAENQKVVEQFSMDSTSSSYQTIQIGHITSLSTTGLHAFHDSDQNEVVPDAVEYQTPFGQLVSGKTTTTKPDLGQFKYLVSV